MKLREIYQSYEGLLADVEQEFNRVRNIFGARILCAKGCSSCCHQLFPISLIEAAYVSKAVKGLDPDARDEMQRKARSYLLELTDGKFRETHTVEEHSELVGDALDRLAGVKHIPCPALENDSCSIYSNRPIIARKWGIPLWNPKNPNVLQACDLNFKAGEVIEGDGLVEPQMELEYRWLSWNHEVLESLDLADVVATVASAVLFDYEALLQEKADSSE